MVGWSGLDVCEPCDPILSPGFLKTQDHSVRLWEPVSKIELKSFFKAWLRGHLLQEDFLKYPGGPRVPLVPGTHLAPAAELLCLCPFSQLDCEFLEG